MAFSKFQAFYNHPAGPKTIHFWAPTFKWAINIANVVDISTKPAETVSYPQQAALACSGLIWAKYSTVITRRIGTYLVLVLQWLQLLLTNFHVKFSMSSSTNRLLQKNGEENWFQRIRE